MTVSIRVWDCAANAAVVCPELPPTTVAFPDATAVPLASTIAYVGVPVGSVAVSPTYQVWVSVAALCTATRDRFTTQPTRTWPCTAAVAVRWMPVKHCAPVGMST